MMEGSNQAKSIPSTGLTVVVEPEKVSLDIVFVHGFTGHPERTWTHKKGDARPVSEDDVESVERPSKIRKLNLLSKSRSERSCSSVYWPRDLIPATQPDARILTYGYDTHIRHRLGPTGSKDSVYNIAWDFLVALEANRRHNPGRPVVFVVHSLGGIVVKEMLRRSNSCRQGQIHLRDVFESTIGLMFFGTPHNGADPGGFLRSVAEQVFNIAGFTVNRHILDTLLPSSERLKELRDEFGPIALEQNWMIHSFQEQLGITALRGDKVVEDTSSYLNLPAIEITERIGRNHMDMCRFTGPNDVEYGKVASALSRITECSRRTAPNSDEAKTMKPPVIDEQQIEHLMSSLKFDQIDARHLTIRQAHAKTCKWLLKTSQYIDWLDDAKMHEHHGILWIKGKPGTGKSTIMKYALAQARKTMKNRHIISFFFNARGELLERSTIGTYRSLLVQLLEKIPSLQCVFNTLEMTSASVFDADHHWDIESLRTLLGNAIQGLAETPVICFIDALDECDELQIRDMISFFESVGEMALSSGIQFRIVFASRHYPHVTIHRSIGLILEGQEGHRQDIANYLSSELKIGHSKFAEQIRTDVQEKSSGIFMWVILVVRILNMEYDRGRIHGLQRKLREIPADLYELFQDILTRDTLNREELILSLQWVLFARTPLKPEELYFAILSETEPEVAISEWDRDLVTKEVIHRFILNATKGLSEITKSKTPTVQFIHESVRDFLLKEDGLRKISADLGHTLEGRSHERLKLCCVNNLDVQDSLNDVVDGKRDHYILSYPFLEYAVTNIFYHADAAEAATISQADFLSNFPLERWVEIHNLYQKHESRKYSLSVSLLYLLAERNVSHLIKASAPVPSYLQTGNGRHGPPFLAALAHGNGAAIRAFLEAHVQYCHPNRRLQELYDQCCQSNSTQIKLGLGFRYSNGRPVLSYLAEFGFEDLFAFVLETGEVPPDAPDTRTVFQTVINKRTQLSWAAEKGHENICKLLLNTGKVDPDARDGNGQTPLSLACQDGHTAIVKLLLETGKVNPDSKDEDGQTPLSLACQDGHTAIVKLLLETGKVNPDSKDEDGQTPLSFACQYGFTAIAKLLLETGKVNPDSKDKSWRTPLFWSAYHGYPDVVKLLLETGKVDLDSKDENRRTPLSLACQYGYTDIVELLFKTSKVDPDSKDKNGRTPLSLTCQEGYAAIAELLLETSKVDPDSKDNYGQTPLSLACEHGHAAVVELLLETGKVDPDSKDNCGRTPLSWSAFHGNPSVVGLLLETGKVDLDSKNRNGQTPLSLACQDGHTAIVKLLLETGKVDPDSKDDRGRTPLSWSAYPGYPDVVELLLETGSVDVNSKSRIGQTPIFQTIYSPIPIFPQRNNRGVPVARLLLNTGKVDMTLKDSHGRTALEVAKDMEKPEFVELFESYIKQSQRC